jgi:hypothetical protein
MRSANGRALAGPLRLNQSDKLGAGAQLAYQRLLALGPVAPR